MKTILGIRAACVLAASLLPAAAGAASLDLYTAYSFYSKQLESESVFVEGGGTCTTCGSLTSGLDTAAITYRIEYLRDDPLPDTYSNYQALSGGTVAFGYISGNITGSLETTQGNDDQVGAALNASFSDVLVITPADPALLGTPGVLAGTLQLEQELTAAVTADPGVPNELFGAQANWLLKVNGINQANANIAATDDDGAISGYFLNSGASGSPVPPSILVPFLIGFTFGDPFELAVEIQTDAFSGGASSPAPGQVWNASSGLNFLHTLTWQGIDSVVDGEGNPVEFLVSAESGTDWTQPIGAPVPAPATLGLLATAMAGVVPALRRRRRAA